MFQYAEAGPLVVVGASGVVGQRLVPLLAERERRPLLLLGRSRERAEALLSSVRAANGEASFVACDLASPPASKLTAAAVVGLVNDPDDLLLMAAAQAGVPFVDITRWTSRVAAAIGRISVSGARAPVVLASGWMGGLLARVAALLAAELAGPIERIDGAIRYALRDAAGADSVDYIDRLWIPFDATNEGRPVVVRPLSGAKRLLIGGQLTTVRRFDTPEQWSLPLTLGARSAAVSLGFDSAFAGAVLAGATQLGVFRWLSGARFRGLRHALLRGPGAEHRAGAPAAFRVDVSAADGSRRSASLRCEAGQAKLTAIGAWLALRFALTEPERPGIRFPELDEANASLQALVEREGVRFERSAA